MYCTRYPLQAKGGDLSQTLIRSPYILSRIRNLGGGGGGGGGREGEAIVSNVAINRPAIERWGTFCISAQDTRHCRKCSSHPSTEGNVPLPTQNEKTEAFCVLPELRKAKFTLKRQLLQWEPFFLGVELPPTSPD